jgi:hypothetical protein
MQSALQLFLPQGFELISSGPLCEWILLVHKGNGHSVDPPLPCNHEKNVNTITVSNPCPHPYFPLFAL